MKKKIQNWKSYEYREVWEILSMKDGCVWKTKSIGFIHEDDADKYPHDKYILSSISTRFRGEEFTTMSPYLS